MTNPLCDDDTADCIGFPPSLGDTCPTALVRCVGGELGVQSVKVAQVAVDSVGDTLNTTLTVGTHYGTLLEINGTNPWCDEAIIWVNHEYGMGITVSQSDSWAMTGDISCGGTDVELTSGGTVGSFSIDGVDGSTQADNDLLQGLTRHHSFVEVYKVPASGAFTIRQQCRLIVASLDGTDRTLGIFVSTMKLMTMLRQT